MEKEIWKDIEGYEGLYQISSLGRAKSLDRIVSGKNGTTRKQKGVMLKRYCGKNGYPIAVLSKDGKKITHTIHRLIALNFLPNPEGKRTVNHIDGVKSNSFLSNLEWATDKENIEHSWKTGLSKPSNSNKNGKKQGENAKNSILKEEDVIFIRKNCKRNGGDYSVSELSNKFGVSQSGITTVISMKSWKHIENQEEIDDYVLSKTGYKNVFVNGGRFQGRFAHNKIKYHCGSFATPEEAYKAVVKKRKEMNLD